MKVAVIGLGMMGSYYAKILSDLLGSENVIGVEIDDERGRAVSEAVGIQHVNDWKTIVQDVDAVTVTLPDDLHVEPAVAFLQAGAYVLVEKPLATSVADTEKILDAQTKSGRLMVAQILRFDPRLQELKRQIETGEFGAIRYIRIWRSNSTATAERIGSRVSVNGFLGIHDLDLLLWLTGQNVRDVTSSGGKFLGNDWDLTISNFTMSSGTVAQVENHWLIHPAAQRSLLAGVQVFGESGMALLDLSTQELEVVNDREPRTRRIDTHNWSFDEHMSAGNLRREISAFVDAAACGEPVPVSGEEGARAVAVMELVNDALNVK